jgi:hypothetical protein
VTRFPQVATGRYSRLVGLFSLVRGLKLRVRFPAAPPENEQVRVCFRPWPASLVGTFWAHPETRSSILLATSSRSSGNRCPGRCRPWGNAFPRRTWSSTELGPPRPPEDDSTRSIGVPDHHGALPVARNSSIFETNLNFRSMSFVTYARISVMRPSLTSKQSQS